MSLHPDSQDANIHIATASFSLHLDNQYANIHVAIASISLHPDNQDANIYAATASISLRPDDQDASIHVAHVAFASISWHPDSQDANTNVATACISLHPDKQNANIHIATAPYCTRFIFCIRRTKKLTSMLPLHPFPCVRITKMLDPCCQDKVSTSWLLLPGSCFQRQKDLSPSDALCSCRVRSGVAPACHGYAWNQSTKHPGPQ